MVKNKVKIGIVDTMFSRVNMGAIAIDEIKKTKKTKKIKNNYPDVEIIRTTVPGVKDLPPECKKLLDSGCDICLALGMVGGATIDTQCAHEASLGIMNTKLMTNKHIIEVFVHENEAWSEEEFYIICENRVRKHAHNAILLATNPGELIQYAGKGIRQGREDEGEISLIERPIVLGIVVGEFNNTFTNAMLDFALEEAKNEKAVVHSIIRVPGVFEIPLGVKKLLCEKKIDAVVTLGYVKKGETMHDRIIAKSAVQKIMELSLQNNKPISLGIITIADEKQAEERKKDYAQRAVRAAVKMVKSFTEYL